MIRNVAIARQQKPIKTMSFGVLNFSIPEGLIMKGNEK